MATDGKITWQRRHLLGLEGLSRQEIETILDLAASMRAVNNREIKKVPTLRGKTVINLFYENSTRTRTSFELAGKRMSADVINFSVAASSAKKGETLLDTVANLQAMTPDVVVIRHSESGAPMFLTQHLHAAVINAGDGRHEHPTQALLDFLTIRDHLPHLGRDSCEGLTVAICGDVLHSRVARSNAIGLRTLGANVRFIGPSTLMPSRAEEVYGVKVFNDMGAGLAGADVVIMLRLQLERMEGAYVPSVREYFKFWGLNQKRLAMAAPHAIVMHPGPMNRGVEIASDVADNPERAVIFEQVANGLAVRMAVLYLLCGGGPRKDELPPAV
ncbi:MAG: aspartate carbamoyltransferase catalytic subunit [Magnetococcales bacterium]|nr:aspartate carbamoyltransferase catalytic subunit [Magnetococcales bacterium]